MFNTGPTLSAIDYNSLVLNDEETHLLLVGNHELSFINLENMATSLENTIVDGISVVLPRISEIYHQQLFDACNVNRPVVQWNPLASNQYVVGINRVARIYAVDHGRVQETNAIIDSQHQVSFSSKNKKKKKKNGALAGSRTRVGCLEGNHANRYTTNASILSRINSLFHLASNFDDRLFATRFITIVNRFT